MLPGFSRMPPSGLFRSRPLRDVPLDEPQPFDVSAARLVVDGHDLAALLGRVLGAPLGARHHLHQVSHFQLLHVLLLRPSAWPA